jgi:hypothetical protein
VAFDSAVACSNSVLIHSSACVFNHTFGDVFLVCRDLCPLEVDLRVEVAQCRP